MVTARISETATIVARPENLASSLGEDAVLLNMETGRYFGLNATGKFIWETIQQPTAVSEIQRRLSENFDISVDACRTDVVKVLEQMLANSLIEVR